MKLAARIGWWLFGAALIFAAIYVTAEVGAMMETAHFERAGL